MPSCYHPMTNTAYYAAPEPRLLCLREAYMPVRRCNWRLDQMRQQHWGQFTSCMKAGPQSDSGPPRQCGSAVLKAMPRHDQKQLAASLSPRVCSPSLLRGPVAAQHQLSTFRLSPAPPAGPHNQLLMSSDLPGRPALRPFERRWRPPVRRRRRKPAIFSAARSRT